MSIQSDKVVTLGDAQVLYDDLADRVVGLKSAITRPEFIVGNAEEVLSDRGETDEAVYLFRKTGGTKKAYNREQVHKLVGGTVAWNQQIQNGDFSASTGWSGSSGSVAIVSNKLTFTATAKSNFAYVKADSISSSIIGHKYFVSADITISEASNNVALYRGGIYADRYFTVAANTKTRCSKICSATYENSNFYVYPMREGAGIEVSSTMTLENVVCIDLTVALGSTIADHLYTMETQTAGSGVAVFRSLFGKSYYQYSAGSLESVNVSEHSVTGFNAWDEVWESGVYDTSTGSPSSNSSHIRSKNAIPCIGGADYFATIPSGKQITLLFWDGNGNYMGIGTRLQYISNHAFTTPSGAATMKFYINVTSYENDMCLNLSDTNRNGQYEPYQLYTYSMPNVTLRGIPKLNGNEIVFDGDELTPDGTVTRKYGYIDLGDQSWTMDSSKTGLFTSNITDAPNNTGAQNVPNILNAKYMTVAAQGVTYWRLDTRNKICSLGYDTSYIYILDTDYSDADTFKTAMSGVYLVYELKPSAITTESADPYQELQICNRYGTEEYVDRLATAETSPRDVAIPCGHQTFYPVNVFDYIDELTKPDNNFIADANIASGKYFSVGNGLYLSTQAIAQGETIIPGTNCTAVSLADALNTINQ